MNGFKFTTFVMYIILLITFLGLINMIFNLHRFLFFFEFMILLGLLPIALISTIGINSDSRWAWILSKILFIFTFLNILFINVVSDVNDPYLKYLLIVTAVGFFISFFNISKAKEEVVEEAEKTVKDTKTVSKTFKPGKFIASKSGAKYHAPKCDWAKKIKKSNAIWFDSKEAAKKAGYKKDDCVN
jgi:predicted membrane protein